SLHDSLPISCSCCGDVLESLVLSIRRWRCPSCLSVNDRDENASLNIKRVGSSTLGVGDVRQSQTAISV
ncbi:MAG: zinc ribbon domain-containing protein, partial [Nostoc sp.]